MGLPLDLILVVCVLAALVMGYPVALTLGGLSVLFALGGWALGAFDLTLFYAIPSRVFGIFTNGILLAIPMFVFMGVVLEKTRIAADMLDAVGRLTSGRSGGLATSVVLVGAMLAASTGVAGASVIMLGSLALPTMLAQGMQASRATGTVAAAGTLGQIIPPSIVLIVLGDQISNAWQRAQTQSGNFAPDTVSVADLFAGALLPGLLLVILFVIYLLVTSRRLPAVANTVLSSERAIGLWRALTPPLLLIIAVLGSILFGLATPSEAASVGAVGALLLGVSRLDRDVLRNILDESVHLTAMIFLIVIGASLFSLVFRGFGGEETISALLGGLPGGTFTALFVVMLVIFVLGFFLEFLEITFIVVPLVAPILLAMPMGDGSMMSPVWLGVLIALNLQTSFLTPPFGVSLFYLRSVAPAEIRTVEIYRGVVPFILLQLVALALVMTFPTLATFLPNTLFAG